SGPAPGGCRPGSPGGCPRWRLSARRPPNPQPEGGEGGMRTTAVTVLAIIGGLVAGLVVSEIIGIIAMLLFDTAAGIKFLPVYLALAGAIAAPVLYRRSRHRAGPR